MGRSWKPLNIALIASVATPEAPAGVRSGTLDSWVAHHDAAAIWAESCSSSLNNEFEGSALDPVLPSFTQARRASLAGAQNRAFPATPADDAERHKLSLDPIQPLQRIAPDLDLATRQKTRLPAGSQAPPLKIRSSFPDGEQFSSVRPVAGPAHTPQSPLEVLEELSMLFRPSRLLPVLLFGLCSSVLAELPLPDATLYGQITTPAGAPVAAGMLIARVSRGGVTVLETEGKFVNADGASWFVVRIPLETNISAPGPSGLAAREGDSFTVLLVDGKTVSLGTAVPALVAGRVTRADGTVDAPPAGLAYIRGDCSPDLRLNVSDAVRVLNFLFVSPEAPPCLAACDADASGTLNITDGVYVLAFLFLGGPAPPRPGPTCGVDTSPGALECASSICNV